MNAVGLLTRMKITRVNPYGLVLVPLVFGLDQLSKALVVANIPLYESVPAEGFFRLTYAQNFGTVFGLFSRFGDVIVWLSLSVAVLLFVLYLFMGSKWRFAIPLGMMLGGALGNIVDRFRLEYVVDFIDVGAWPIFNVADSAITVGAVLIALYAFTDGRDKDSEPSPAASAEIIGDAVEPAPPYRSVPSVAEKAEPVTEANPDTPANEKLSV